MQSFVMALRSIGANKMRAALTMLGTQQISLLCVYAK